MPATRRRPRAALARTCAHIATLLLLGTGATLGDSGDFERMRALAAERYGAEGASAVSAWEDTVARGRVADGNARLELVNAFFNDRVIFGDDEEIWRQRDYWATPLETLGRGRGDCEDFSVAKYVTLRLLGVPDARLRLVYVKAAIGGPRSRVTQAHMVVAYYPADDAEPLILDNLVPRVLPASRRPDLTPVFSFNAEGLWVGSRPEVADKQPERRLSHWRGVLERMRREGLRQESGSGR